MLGGGRGGGGGEIISSKLILLLVRCVDGFITGLGEGWGIWLLTGKKTYYRNCSGISPSYPYLTFMLAKKILILQDLHFLCDNSGW